MLELEEKQAKEAKVITVVTQLGLLPPLWRRVMIAGAWCIMLSSYPLIFFSSRCFEPFDLATDEIAELCLYSCDAPKRPFIKKSGLAIFFLVAIGILLSFAFNSWTAKQIAGRPRTGSNV